MVEVSVQRLAWLALLVVLASLSNLAPAAAQPSDDEQAHSHFEVAASYYEQANYESALREFLEAYRLSQRSQLFYNLSLCYQQLGDLANAVSYLERYLHDVTDISNRASLETRLANLQSRLESQRATGADPGESGGSGTGEPSGAGDTGAGTTTTGDPGAGSSAGGSTGSATPSPGGDSLNVGAIAAFSVAGVGLILGATFTGLAASEESRVAALGCASSRSCTSADVSGMRTDALVADILWGVSLAGAAVGLVLVLVNPGGGASDRAALRVSPTLGGLTASGRF